MGQYLKSKILEFLTRKILFNCGFSCVTSDGLYIYDHPPLQMINGKGAAHDADVIMNPPIQMPFTYPTRIIFECKAYSKSRKVGVDIVRNASGFRNDINDFEIITEEFLQHRQNNHRVVLAISDRKRHYYQVGISTLFNFSKPALEFAANNKIPLLSFSELFAGTGLAEAIDGIPANIENLIGSDSYNSLTSQFSQKNMDNVDRDLISGLMNENEILSRCLSTMNAEIENVYVGVLESGEILFIKKDSIRENEDVLRDNTVNLLKARIRWNNDEREKWWVEFDGVRTRYYFYLPRDIAKSWKSYNDVRAGAREIKELRFARFFIFNKGQDNRGFPFKLVNLDIDWLRRLV